MSSRDRWAPARRLPVGETIRGALRVLAARPGHFASLMVVPVLLSVLLALHQPAHAGSAGNLIRLAMNMGLALLGLLPFVLFAVWCHRSILLDSSSVLVFGSFRWGERENRFAVWIVCIYFVLIPGATVALLAPAWLVGETLGTVVDWAEHVPNSLLPVLFIAPFSYVVARSLLVFPATAVDLDPSLSRAWRLSYGNGWRLALVVVLLPYGLYGIVGEAVDAWTPKEYSEVAGIVASYGVALFEVALLSVAFRSLASEDLIAQGG